MNPSQFSRRERQIMDALFRLGEATAAEVREAIPSPPGYSAIRAQLRILVEKGHVTHRDDGQRYVYRPTQAAETAQRTALRHVVQTFFDGSPADAVAALLDGKPLDDSEYERLARLVETARKAGR